MKDLAIVLACAAASTAQAQFSAPQPIEITEIAYLAGAAVADLNGDGASDVVAAGQASMDGMYLYLNDGAGNYSDAILVDNTSYVDYAVLVVAGDVDADGDVDLVGMENYTRAFLHRNTGNAQFEPAVEIIAGIGDIRASELVDVDGDLDRDLLVIDYNDDEVLWYANTGSGTFGAAQAVVGIPSMPWDMVWVRVDGDADPDLVVSGVGGECRWFSNLGGGSFGPAQSLGEVGDGYDLELTDLDGDGDNDLLSGDESSGTITWRANDGNGGFGAPTTLATLESWYKNVALDMDGDGDIDVVPAGEICPYWLENDGTGAFTQRPLNARAFGAMAPADMDGDGDTDLYAIGSRITWLPNDGNGNMGHRRVICGMVHNIAMVRLVDLDGDADPDVVSNDSGNEHMIVSYRNDGTGTYGLQEMLLDSVPIPQYPEFIDLDSDADMDLVLKSYDALQTFLNDGSGTFTPGQYITSDFTYSDIALADMDGDGDVDIVMPSENDGVIRMWMNNGAGAFGPAPGTVPLSDPGGVEVGDLDDDGDVDVVGLSYGTYQVTAYLNDGTGGLTGTVSPPVTIDAQAESTRLADINGDGMDDLVLCDGDGVYACLSLGGGSFQAQVTLATLSDGWPRLRVADVDEDGAQDLVVLLQDAEAVQWYANDGTGTFGPAQPLDPDVNGTPQDAAFGDVDGDGDADIVLGHGNGNDSYGIDWYESFVNSNYHIQGTVYHDANEDGVQGVGETGLPFVMATAVPIAAMPLTDANGDYDIAADQGTYTVQPILPNAWWGIVSAAQSYTVTLDDTTPISTGNDFGIAPVVDTTMVDIACIGSLGPCGDTTTYFFTLTNLGTTRPSGTLCGMLDPLLTIVGLDPAPTSSTGNMYCWEIDSLYYYTPFVIAAEIVNPDASMIGTLITAGLQLTEVDALGNILQTYQAAWAAPVACSYDPNDKQVSPAGHGEAGAVDIDTERLTYTIRFQNTGNAPAQNVVLVDHLATELDPTTLEVVGYSHPPTSITVAENGDLVVRFDGIQLPDSGASFTGSQGFFRFAIKVDEGLANGTAIQNTANIHFDLNAPVVTNTTTTTLVDCDLATAHITVEDVLTLHAGPGDAYQWFLNGEPIPGATEEAFPSLVNGSYACEVTTALGCVVMTDAYSVTSVSIGEEEGFHMALVPNPMTTSAQVVFDAPLLAGDAVEIVGISGQVLATFTGQGSSTVTIDRGPLADGVYSVRVVRGGAARATMRMVVMGR